MSCQFFNLCDKFANIWTQDKKFIDKIHLYPEILRWKQLRTKAIKEKTMNVTGRKEKGETEEGWRKENKWKNGIIF